MTSQSGTTGPATTVVHLVRHGEVHNPSGVLYGRLPGYHLSERGRQMADMLAESFRGHDVTHVVASPLDRAQETAQPISDLLGLPVVTDPRLIEAANHFQGMQFGVGDGSLRHPAHWRYLANPLRPSWGEPYRLQVNRVLAALADVRDSAAGHEAVVVSHQLPIWVTRSFVEGRHLWHDPRKRECTLASVTTFTYVGADIVAVSYSEPARSLLPGAGKVSGA
jgi:broad specificity phosphatase PhoE